MTTTSAASTGITTAFAAVAVWGSTASRCGGGEPVSNPTHAHTEMAGGQVVYENDNYRITMGDDNSVDVFNKHTGERYEVWGDPHMKVDGQQAFDFWGTTTLQLDDGTKVTIETTPSGGQPGTTLASTVTITNGDYGVQVTGVDSRRTGDLQFHETQHFGGLLDAAVADGNVLHENPFGAGFLGVDARGHLRRVDQQYINETDLKKGGALQERWADAFRRMAGLIAVSFVGGFLSGLAAATRRDGNPAPTPRQPAGREDGGAAFVLVLSRSDQSLTWFAGAAAWQGAGATA